MEAKQISKLIESELAERDSFDWQMGWSEQIEDLIIEPFEGNFFVPETMEYEDFWVVADLEPEKEENGFLLIYDVDTDLFGLARKAELFNEGSGELVGLYGTIGIALENMPE